MFQELFRAQRTAEPPPQSDLISMIISLKLITQHLTCTPHLPSADGDCKVVPRNEIEWINKPKVILAWTYLMRRILLHRGTPADSCTFLAESHQRYLRNEIKAHPHLQLYLLTSLHICKKSDYNHSPHCYATFTVKYLIQPLVIFACIWMVTIQVTTPRCCFSEISALVWLKCRFVLEPDSTSSHEQQQKNMFSRSRLTCQWVLVGDDGYDLTADKNQTEGVKCSKVCSSCNICITSTFAFDFLKSAALHLKCCTSNCWG